MQLALRRGFGYAYPPRGIYGLGEDGASATVTTNDPAADPLLTDESGNVCLASMFENGQCPAALPVQGTPSGGSLFSQLIAQGVNPADACAYDPAGCKGLVPNTTPGPALTPAELGAEQARASAWLAQIPGALSTTGKLVAALTTAQIAAGVQAGALKPSSTCPSGYLVAGSGQCVGSASPTLLPGISNTAAALGVVAALFLFLFLGRGR